MARKIPFSVDITGSFVYSEALVEARKLFQDGVWSAVKLKEIEDKEIFKIVEKCKEIGLKCVTDGDYKSTNYIDFFHHLQNISKQENATTPQEEEEPEENNESVVSGKIDFDSHFLSTPPVTERFTYLTGIIGGDKNELIFKGTKRDIKTIKEALKHFDKKQKELVIKGYIYEVTTTKSDASGLSIVADVFKNAGVAITNGTKLSNFLSFKNSDVDFYFSALSKDDRFKILSRPSLRVRNHQSATLTVGRDVPTLGNVTYQDGQAVQSVTYRSSGVIFEIVPEILRKTVNLQIRQEMSNFAETVNGVNGSPTLVKRELKTNVTASSGETLVLGGLIENKDTDSSAGLSFLPSWTGAKSNTKENTEILLMLYVEII